MAVLGWAGRDGGRVLKSSHCNQSLNALRSKKPRLLQRAEESRVHVFSLENTTTDPCLSSWLATLNNIFKWASQPQSKQSPWRLASFSNTAIIPHRSRNFSKNNRKVHLPVIPLSHYTSSQNRNISAPEHGNTTLSRCRSFRFLGSMS